MESPPKWRLRAAEQAKFCDPLDAGADAESRLEQIRAEQHTPVHLPFHWRFSAPTVRAVWNYSVRARRHPLDRAGSPTDGVAV